MRVRCIALVDSRGRPVERSPWLEVGSIYHVLAISAEPGHIRLRIVGEEPTPVLLRPELFEVVSSKTPPSWAVTSPQPGCLSFQPEAWAVPGFWERYFDGEPEACAIFEEERAKIIAADP